MFADWRPIDPAVLALKQSATDPNADAEALFREVHVSSEQLQYVKNFYSEYVRIKVFTERGKDRANVELPYFGKTTIYGVQGRTIHPDGSVVELAKDAIFDKVLEKRGFKTKVITFALPSVEPGSIIEYRYSATEGDDTHYYGNRELEVQSSFPVDEVTFYIKPLPANLYGTMRYMPFGCNPQRGDVTRDGYDVFTIKNVPAYHEEPDSPPLHSSREWVLIFYEENSKTGKDKFWSELGKERYKRFSEFVKVNDEVKSLADQITAGAKTDDEKLDKLLEYCRTQIKDVRGDEITTAELDKAKANKNTVDTIRRKEGDDFDIQMAFLALARGAGFDARRADLSDRSKFIFAPVMQSSFFLNAFDIAVNVGGKWKFFDVTNHALPGGQLRWQEQAVYALLTDSKDPEMVTTPMVPASESNRNRIATFTISEDGVLEGNVREFLSGNVASDWRQRNIHTNQTQREEEVRDEIKHRFADFEMTNLRITASPNPAMAIRIDYHIVVHNYAQRTGKRLFVQPNYFAAGFGARFPEATRHNNVYFEYPWSESDSVDVTAPAGFLLDHGDAPPGINIPPVCAYTVKIGYDKAKGLIQYRRQFAFGDKDLLLFDVKNYATLKKVFDLMHEDDNHMLIFKNDATPTAVSQ